MSGTIDLGILNGSELELDWMHWTPFTIIAHPDLFFNYYSDIYSKFLTDRNFGHTKNNFNVRIVI